MNREAADKTAKNRPDSLNDKFDMLIETWDLSYPKDDLNKASK
jgi:hypothetical protein